MPVLLLLLARLALAQTPVPVHPGSWELLADSEEVRTCVCDMWKEASFGVDPDEKAAWILKITAGYRCIRWKSDEPGQARTRGVPKYAVAIVHTHPTRSHYKRSGPRPSEQDEKVADKYEIPIYAISEELWGYSPSTEKTTRHEKSGWRSRFSCPK